MVALKINVTQIPKYLINRNIIEILRHHQLLFLPCAVTISTTRPFLVRTKRKIRLISGDLNVVGSDLPYSAINLTQLTLILLDKARTLLNDNIIYNNHQGWLFFREVNRKLIHDLFAVKTTALGMSHPMSYSCVFGVLKSTIYKTTHRAWAVVPQIRIFQNVVFIHLRI